MNFGEKQEGADIRTLEQELERLSDELNKDFIEIFGKNYTVPVDRAYVELPTLIDGKTCEPIERIVMTTFVIGFSSLKQVNAAFDMLTTGITNTYKPSTSGRDILWLRQPLTVKLHYIKDDDLQLGYILRCRLAITNHISIERVMDHQDRETKRSETNDK